MAYVSFIILVKFLVPFLPSKRFKFLSFTFHLIMIYLVGTKCRPIESKIRFYCTSRLSHQVGVSSVPVIAFVYCGCLRLSVLNRFALSPSIRWVTIDTMYLPCLYRLNFITFALSPVQFLMSIWLGILPYFPLMPIHGSSQGGLT